MLSQRQQFTLIEALVVIAVIGSLMSLLIPSLKSMLKTQQKLLCLNNTRLVYTVSLLYGDDHDDFLPRRTGASLPHNIQGSKYDFNKTLIEPYAENRDNFFCQSTLLDARNPNHYNYRYKHVTYSYFHDYKMGDRWKASQPSYEKTSSVYDHIYPLWGCLTIQLPSGLWFGHDRPIVAAPPEGQNACFIDGSAKWNELEDLEVFYSNGTQHYYWPKPL